MQSVVVSVGISWGAGRGLVGFLWGVLRPSAAHLVGR